MRWAWLGLVLCPMVVTVGCGPSIARLVSEGKLDRACQRYQGLDRRGKHPAARRLLRASAVQVRLRIVEPAELGRWVGHAIAPGYDTSSTITVDLELRSRQPSALIVEPVEISVGMRDASPVSVGNYLTTLRVPRVPFEKRLLAQGKELPAGYVFGLGHQLLTWLHDLTRKRPKVFEPQMTVGELERIRRWARRGDVRAALGPRGSVDMQRRYVRRFGDRVRVALYSGRIGAAPPRFVSGAPESESLQVFVRIALPVRAGTDKRCVLEERFGDLYIPLHKDVFQLASGDAKVPRRAAEALRDLAARGWFSLVSQSRSR